MDEDKSYEGRVARLHILHETDTAHLVFGNIMLKKDAKRALQSSGETGLGRFFADMSSVYTNLAAIESIEGNDKKRNDYTFVAKDFGKLAIRHRY